MKPITYVELGDFLKRLGLKHDSRAFCSPGKNKICGLGWDQPILMTNIEDKVLIDFRFDKNWEFKEARVILK